MGKIVKYCADCEEGFAEKFGFCPNCGGHLAAYEMNPVTGMAQTKPATPVEAETSAPVSNTQAFEATSDAPKTFAADASPQSFNNEIAAEAPVETPPVVKISEPESIKSAPVAPPRAAAAVAGGFQKTQPTPEPNYSDGQYHITFVEEKDNGTRGALLLGAFTLVMALTVGATVYSLFANSLFVGALEDEGILNTYVAAVDDAPEPIEPDPPKPKNEDKGGGGGGGGNKDPNPVSKGVLASQSEKPLIPPSVTMSRVTNPAIPIRMETQGKRQEPPTDQPYGNPNSKFNVPSDGGGSGGGQGAGQGRGQGNGIGTGAGNGIGSGNGNGRGNGNGDGDGDGDEGSGPPAIRKPPPVGPTERVKILAKPRANYTDAARQNQVTGVVRVRVSFLPNGAIGSVTPVSTLPYGLTEQALAAARSIKFEPAKKNGVPVAANMVVEYSFTIY